MTKAASKLGIMSDQARANIDQWIAKYPEDQKQSAVMAALTIMQDENGGWIKTEQMDAVAEYLDMPAIAVYEVATFYSMYEMKPVGRHKICVCTNISCLLCGLDDIVKHLNDKLGIKFGEITEDGKFSLKEVECLGACVGAPAVMIGKDYHENLTPEKLDKLLDELD